MAKFYITRETLRGKMKIKTVSTYKLLEEYIPSTNDEAVYKKQMLELLDTCDNCYERSNKVGHFTASALVLNKEKTHVLLMHHAKLNIWVQPGGHCDGDEDVSRVAIKEAQEETGIKDLLLITPDIFDIDIHLLPDHKGVDAHYHFDVRFLLHAYADDTFVKNHESLELRWVDVFADDMLSDKESVTRLFNKIRLLNL
jgi:8-oxo-dGTP pyrophosphatase MutT (NUDIX family)